MAFYLSFEIRLKQFLETALDKLKRDLLESGYSSTIFTEVPVDNNISARRLSEVCGLSETFRDYCNHSAHLNVGDEKYWKKNLLGDNLIQNFISWFF